MSNSQNKRNSWLLRCRARNFSVIIKKRLLSVNHGNAADSGGSSKVISTSETGNWVRRSSISSALYKKSLKIKKVNSNNENNLITSRASVDNDFSSLMNAKNVLAPQEKEVLNSLIKADSVERTVESVLGFQRKVENINQLQRRLDGINNLQRQLEGINKLPKQSNSVSREKDIVGQANKLKNVVDNVSALQNSQKISTLLNHSRLYFLQSSSENLLKIHTQINGIDSFKKQLEKALACKAELDKAESFRSLKIVEAFSRKFDNYDAFDRHLMKAASLQKELDKALASNKANEIAEKIKSQLFSKMKEQNYRASLKLEGLSPSDDVKLNTLESIRSKYAG